MVDAKGQPPTLDAPSDELKERVKTQLRQHLRNLRKAHPAVSLSARSRQICERIAQLEWFTQAKGVALFWPLLERGEVDLRPLDEQARRLNKRVYYPFMDQKPDGYDTGFRLVGALDDLRIERHGFLQPRPTAATAARGDLDLVVVPALGVAPSGHRIGYGVGYYDATLGDFCPPAHSLVVAFDFQVVSEVPALAHDVACDAVLTETQSFGT